MPHSLANWDTGYADERRAVAAELNQTLFGKRKRRPVADNEMV